MAGITNASEEELIKDDSTYREIQQIMSEVFGKYTWAMWSQSQAWMKIHLQIVYSDTSDSEGADLDEPASNLEE